MSLSIYFIRVKYYLIFNHLELGVLPLIHLDDDIKVTNILSGHHRSVSHWQTNFLVNLNARHDQRQRFKCLLYVFVLKSIP